MSEPEYWSGVIKEVKFPETFTPQMKAEFLSANGYNADVDEYYNPPRVVSNTYKSPIFDVDGRIFVNESLSCSEDGFHQMIDDQGDGEYYITAGFYNGGTCITEVVKDLINGLKEEK